MKRWMIAVGLTVLVFPLVHADSMDSMASKLAKGVKHLKSRKVAVLPFTYPEGWTSSGSTLVAEELTTALVGRKKISVVERSQLSKIMTEAKLSLSGAVEPSGSQKLGKILGTDAIVTGSLVDVDERYTKVNARLIACETGEVLSAASAKIDRTWEDMPKPPVVESSQASGASEISSDGQHREMSPLLPVSMGPHKPEYPTAQGEAHDQQMRFARERQQMRVEEHRRWMDRTANRK